MTSPFDPGVARPFLLPLATLGLLTLSPAARQGQLAAHARVPIHGPGPFLLHVDDDAAPGGDGLTWATAFQHLQDALSAAAALGLPGEIRVGAGTYYPDRSEANPTGTGDRTATFQLLTGVALRGGFAGLGGGMGTLPDDRDVALYVSVLDGDLLANGMMEDNAYSVVRGGGVDATAELDGFTITHGSADTRSGYDGGGDFRGGGLWCLSGCPTVRSCRFVENRAELGGGGYLRNACDMLIEDCVFENNETVGTSGGGLFSLSTDLELRSCTFRGNDALAAGAAAQLSGGVVLVSDALIESNVCSGGAFNVAGGADATFERCTFRDCRAVDRGITEAIGGALIVNFATATLRDCLLTGNEAELDGGAVYCLDALGATIEDCTFLDNESAFSGGALFALRSPVEVLRTRFLSNVAAGTSASTGGGAVFVQNCELTLLDCRILQNEAFARGGGVKVWDDGLATLVNTLVAGNHARQLGGALAAESSLTVTNTAVLVNSTVYGNTADVRGFEGLLSVGGELSVRNSILWENAPGDLVSYDSSVTVEHTTLDSGYPGTGNLVDDPMFVEPLGPDGLPGTEDPGERYDLVVGSPAIDAGDDAAVPVGVTVDLDGAPRFVDGSTGGVGTVDMGALEFQPVVAARAASGRRRADAPRIRWSARRRELDLHDPSAEAHTALLFVEVSGGERQDWRLLGAVALAGGRARLEEPLSAQVSTELRAVFLYPRGPARTSNVLPPSAASVREEVQR